MPGRYFHILTIAGALSLSGFAAWADPLQFLDGHVFVPANGCEVMADPAQFVDSESLPGDYVLVGGAEARHFVATRWPGSCTIDGILTPEMHGAGNGFATVMASLSCIDDTAVPTFDIAVLEFQPERDGAAARVNVYSLNDTEDPLNGEYVACQGPVRDTLDALFLHGSDSDAPG